MEHFRYFEIETDSHCVTIRPDGGIAYGWEVIPGVTFPFRGMLQDQVKVYSGILKSSTLGPKKDTALLATIIIEKLG